jgi:ATP-dependent Clp protease protease subunit
MTAHDHDHPDDRSARQQPSRLDSFLEEKAFKSRYIVLTGEINDRVAASIVTRLIALASDSDKPINFLISSPGGHVESGDAIHDTIKFVRVPVNMIGTGWVGSAGVHVYLAAKKERRFCTENTRFLIHQPSGGGMGTAADIAIAAREIVRARERLARIISRETGQPLERVTEDIDRDYWMNAAEAIDYGLVSKVIATQDQVPSE